MLELDDWAKEKIRSIEVDGRMDLLDGRIIIFRFRDEYWLLDAQDRRAAGWTLPNADEVINFICSSGGSKMARPITVDPSLLTVSI
jgi:hypothetical protein